jgi:hypothetical protein
MPTARVGEINLNYTIQGSGDWLVLIGGYASSNWQSWGTMLGELAKSYRVLAFDNRGIGGSDAPDCPYSTQLLARDALGLMDHSKASIAPASSASPWAGRSPSGPRSNSRIASAACHDVDHLQAGQPREEDGPLVDGHR